MNVKRPPVKAAMLLDEYPRQESNLRLLAPEASALSTELRGLINGKRIAITLRRCQFRRTRRIRRQEDLLYERERVVANRL